MTGEGAWTPGEGVDDRRSEFAAYFCRALRAHAPPADVAIGADWLLLPGAPTQPPDVPAQPAAPRTILMLPGMFGECVAPWTTPFGDAQALLRAQGHRIHVLDLAGRSSSGRNGRAIHAWMGAHAAALDDAVVIAYSKGATDFMHAAVLDADGAWLPRLGALVTIAGVIDGTPLASDWAERLETLLSGIDVPNCGAGDGGAVDSQTYEEAGAAREAYLALPRRPSAHAVVAITDEGSVNPALSLFHRHLSERDPCNDGQMLAVDAVLPGSQLLAVAHADHWSIALPFETSAMPARLLGRNNHFPRVALLSAILDYLGSPAA